MNTSNQSLQNMSLNEKTQYLSYLQKSMINFAYVLTNDWEQAKDLTQETNLRVLSNLGKYYNNLNFKGWIYTIMRNIFINNYRSVLRKKTGLGDKEYYSNVAKESELERPGSSLVLMEIDDALDKLSNTCKDLFNLYVIGYKYIEIAEIMGIPLGTVKSRIFIVRKKLQVLLADYRM